MVRRPKLSEEKRAGIVAGYAAGLSKARIAAKYKCSLPTVDRWVNEGNKAHPNFSDKRRSGRPPLVPASRRGAINRSAGRDKTVPKITIAYNKKSPQPVSESTIRRIVAAGRNPLGWQPVNRGRVLSETNKQKRVAFCSANQRAHVSKWVFVDGKYFYLYRTKHGFCQWSWAKPGGKGAPACKGQPWVYFVYAAVAKGHKSKLYFVPPSPAPGSKARRSKVAFKGRHFRAMLEKMQPEVEGWFKGPGKYSMIIDRASQHTSRASKAALVQLGVPVREGYPPQSWDINIIENVWGVLTAKLVGKHANSTAGWRQAIKAAWDEVEQTTIDKLVAQVPSRMQRILEAGGGWIMEKAAKHMA